MTDFFIITNASRAASYGIGTYTNQLVSYLEEMDATHTHYIEMFANVKEFKKEVDEKGSIHYKIPVVSGYVEDEICCKNAFYFLSKYINYDEKSSLVFQFNYFQHYHLASLLKIAFPGCRIILTVHYFDWCFELKGDVSAFHDYISNTFKEHCEEESDSEYRKRICRNYEHERDFMRLADDVVVLSKATQEIVANDYRISKEKISLINNGIKKVTSLSEKINTNNTFLKDRFKYILFVGRLEESKGVTYLIRAFKKLCVNDDNLRLLVVGDGDFSSCMSAAEGCWDRVVFTGKVSKDQLEYIYSKVYIGVLPSFHEQCSYTAIEMMAHSIPLITSDAIGLNEMLQEIPCCLAHISQKEFVEDEFVESLYLGISKLIYDKKLYGEVSKKVNQIYLDHYSHSRIVENYCQLLAKNHVKIFSDDLQYMIDTKMISLVDSRPDIDLSFFGMTGVGCYLWYRIERLRNAETSTDHSRYLLLQEYMIYWMDWIDETIINELITLPNEFWILIQKIIESGFYSHIAKRFAKIMPPQSSGFLPEKDVLSNALKISRCDV